MKETSGYFSSFDGTQLFYRAWEKSAPNALVIVHGFGEHSGRYEELVEFLRELPFSIYACDLRGHGHSEGGRVYANSFFDWICDTLAFRSLIEKEAKTKPKQFVLLGQSFGGSIGTAAVLEDQSAWRALIVMSPFFKVPFGQFALSFFAYILNLIAPKKIWDNPIRSGFLSHDAEEVRRYREDPLIQRRITARFAREMFRLGEKVWKRALELKLPFLLLASGDDRIVSVDCELDFFKSVSSADKKLQVFDGFYHELLHEVERIKPMAVLKEYLSRLV